MTAELDDDDLRLPLREFILIARDWAESQEATEAADDSLFNFVRALKGHSVLKDCTAAQAHRALREFARARGEPLDIEGIDVEEEDGEVAFYSMWERVRFPVGMDPVEVACAAVDKDYVRTNSQHPGRYKRFLGVACLLQIQVGKKPILLPVRKIAGHMRCDRNTVHSWVNWARQDGVLIQTKRHSFRSQGTSKAAEYVMGIHQWPTAIPTLAALLRLPVRQEDVDWVAEQFAAAREAS